MQLWGLVLENLFYALLEVDRTCFCNDFYTCPISKQLANQEQELEREEEAFYEAKREAARIASLNKEKENQAKSNPAHNRSWANEDEWEIAGGEDDFEIFLANVKARSLATRSQVRNGSGDGHSSSSSNAPTRDKTEGSSLDMEWDHEAGWALQLTIIIIHHEFLSFKNCP
ncbi:AP-1 complex-associated regulatory protein-like isoform X1 [Elysia marginata]|uniref:AP-1 complex-associated regulatory protein-like isoform X1 n=1 Tax=Elysia marginata TaxID=1093978 RepID=A0AAV4HEQ8_9GAST|nr:AP-1 complex-associated regulatory protein-like isoform X1 [Elysia marginata]